MKVHFNENCQKPSFHPTCLQCWRKAVCDAKRALVKVREWKFLLFLDRVEWCFKCAQGLRMKMVFLLRFKWNLPPPMRKKMKGMNDDLKTMIQRTLYIFKIHKNWALTCHLHIKNIQTIEKDWKSFVNIFRLSRFFRSSVIIIDCQRSLLHNFAMVAKKATETGGGACRREY